MPVNWKMIKSKEKDDCIFNYCYALFVIKLKINVNTKSTTGSSDLQYVEPYGRGSKVINRYRESVFTPNTLDTTYMISDRSDVCTQATIPLPSPWPMATTDRIQELTSLDK